MPKPRKNVDLVVPFNNEYSNLQILVPKILKSIKKIKNYKFRLIFIDDGSVDNSFSVIKKYQKKYKNINLIKNSKKQGQTSCYKLYLKKFNSEFFIRMDSDNQDNPIHLYKMTKFLTEGYDMILTDRQIRKHSIYMVILTLIYDTLINILIGKKLKTYSSSLACFKNKSLPFKNLFYNDHRYFPIIAIKNNIKKIKVFPVIHQSRLHGHTKYGMFKKVLFAFPEFLYFFYRLKINRFKK